MKRVNPFVEIYNQCNGKSNIEKYNILNTSISAVPIYLDIELTNCCNMQCNMCPVGTSLMKRPQGFMSDEIFDKLIQNIKKYNIRAVRFIRWGEPTLHPKFIYYASALKELGILVHFNTNGTLLNEKVIKDIIDIEIDSMKFSFQGIDDLTYSEMRGGNYTNLLNFIKLTYQIRGEKISPYISVTTTTTYETEEEIEHFIEEVKPYCDDVNVGRTKMQHVDIGKMKLSKERSKVYEDFIKEDNFLMQRMSVCPEIWDKLSINWDGSVSACCSDYDNMMIVGNIMEEDLKDIFLGAKERYFRQILKDNEYDRISLCKNCFEYIPLKK